MSDNEIARIRQQKLNELMGKKEATISIEKLSEVVVLTDKNFADFVMNESLPVIVDFWAPWCAPCIRAAQYFPNLAKNFAGKIRFAKMNVDENRYTPTSLKVSSIPHFIVFYKGEYFTRFVGALPEPAMEETIQKILKKLNVS